MKNLATSKELKYLAKKYVWWESPAWALAHPTIFLANIMNLGNLGGLAINAAFAK